MFLGNIRDRFTVVSLDEQEYFHTVESAADSGLRGGAINDAILGRCALKAKAQVIFTWNVKDFIRLGPEIARRVKAPHLPI